MTYGASAVGVDTRSEHFFRGCMHRSKRITGHVQSVSRSEVAVEKEMHKPRKAARLCFRSGCNKEAVFVPYFLAFLAFLVTLSLEDIARLC